jgi:hypothetical protein
MKPCLPVLRGALLVVLVGCGGVTSLNSTGKDARPQDKTAAANTAGGKLVGTWRFVRSSNGREPDWGTKLDFTPDGKVAMHATGYANAGTYALENKVLKMKTNVDLALTVTKLTDKELVLEIQLAPVAGNSAAFEYRKE